MSNVFERLVARSVHDQASIVPRPAVPYERRPAMFPQAVLDAESDPLPFPSESDETGAPPATPAMPASGPIGADAHPQARSSRNRPAPSSPSGRPSETPPATHRGEDGQRDGDGSTGTAEAGPERKRQREPDRSSIAGEVAAEAGGERSAGEPPTALSHAAEAPTANAPATPRAARRVDPGTLATPAVAPRDIADGVPRRPIDAGGPWQEPAEPPQRAARAPLIAKNVRRAVSAPSRPPEESRLARTEPASIEPSVHVRIGRIDVRAVMEPPPAPPPQRLPRRPRLDLEEYLRQRNRGER